VKYAFIRQHGEELGILQLCQTLHVSRSDYYDWLRRTPSARTQANNDLLERIRATHRHHR